MLNYIPNYGQYGCGFLKNTNKWGASLMLDLENYFFSLASLNGVCRI